MVFIDWKKTQDDERVIVYKKDKFELAIYKLSSGKYKIIIDKLYSYYPSKKYDFNTKAQAIKFAKAYMRTY